jgi:CHAD domain-containing protein
MTAHKSIHEYYLQQHSNIEYYLEQCAEKAEAEMVHELRLSIKKLRAFHKLAGPLCPENTDELIHVKRRVRKLFSLAGELRDTQVQLHLLVTYEQQNGEQYPEFGRWLLKREKKRMAKFGFNPQPVLPHAKAHLTHQQLGDLLASASEETIKNVSTEVLAGLMNHARRLASGHLSDRNLHRVRTLTKQVRYILSIMHHSFPEYTFEQVQVESLREIEAVAGYWHDNLVKLELLGKCMEKLHFEDEISRHKYEKFYNECKAALDTAYFEACRVVRSELLA